MRWHCLPMAFRPFAAKRSIKKLGALCSEQLILLGEGEAPGSSEQSIPFSCGEVAGMFQGTDLCRPRGWAAPAILPSTSSSPTSCMFQRTISLQDKGRSGPQHNTQLLAQPLHTTVPSTQVGKTMTPIPARTYRMLSGVPLEHHLCTTLYSLQDTILIN